MQRTLILLKHDAIDRGLVGAILARFEKANLRLENCRFLQPDVDHWQRHYADLKARQPAAFERTTRYLAGKPAMAVILTGTNAIQKARSMIGGTDPLSAAPGTIRGDWGNDSIALADAENRATANLVHAADSEASVAVEIALWFA
jgi:nucleoside-diphosphate kinase